MTVDSQNPLSSNSRDFDRGSIAYAGIILDSPVLQGGASRRAGGRDERPPQSSSPGAANSATQRWIPPSSLKRDALNPDDHRHNGIFRRVRGTLNKLTPEKFDKLSLELLNVGIDSQVVLKGIILLIFEKALDEPKYSSLYAQLCQRLCEDTPNFEPPSSNISTFKRLLINKCQDEFENRSRATEIFDQKDGPLTADEEEQFVVAKHKMLGNIKFIGELGKLELLHEGIMHKCIKQLLASKRARHGATPVADMAEDLECLCQIMRTVGRRLDTDKAKALMDQYFMRMKVYMMNAELPSRIRFMLQDTIELRGSRWVPRKILRENGPKTIQQVRQEAAKEIGLYMPNHAAAAASPPMMAPQNMDLFGRPLNNGTAGPRPQPMPDVFGGGPVPLSPPFLSGGGLGGIGTGPGTIHIDNFAAGFRRGGGGGNQGYRGGGGGYQGGRRHQDNRGNSSSPKFFPDDDQSRHHDHRQGYKNGTGHQREGSDERQYNRNNREGNQFNNREGQNFQRNNFRGGQQPAQNQQMAQKDLEKLPPRFRKQLQMQQQGGGGGGSTGGNYRSEAGMNGALTPPMDSRSPSHTPPPPPASSAPALKSGGGGGGEEINLRPASLRNYNPTFRPNIPSMLPKSTQSAQQAPRHDVRPILPVDPPIIQQPQITIKKVPSNDKMKEKEQPKAKTLTPDELKVEVESILSTYLTDKDVKQAVRAVKDLKPPRKFLPELVSILILTALQKEENEREEMSNLVKELKDESLIDADHFMDGFNTVLDRLKDLEGQKPLVKSELAKVAARAACDEVVGLTALAEPLRHGAHHPLFLLCLQQARRASVGAGRDKDWLVGAFQASKIDLVDMLPESEGRKERLEEILEERGLTFLFPLLRVQGELWRQLIANNPTQLYKWIKDHVPADLHRDPAFIHTLVSSIVKYIVGESTLVEGQEASATPDKAAVEKEKELLAKYQGVLRHFAQDSLSLQIHAIYAMQVFVHQAGFPKGMLLRLFMQMYDHEVVDEEAFIKWKEEVNDEYPGKGKALFQVNTWLTWLEQAESESDEDDDDEE